jgi:hypothetical protein
MKKRKGELLSNTSNVKNSKFVANNTLRIEYENGNISFRLHETDIVTFLNDNKIILNSGTWKTHTTKERINRFSPANVYQKNGIWYLSDNKLFYDGCIINAKGELISKPLKNEIYENKVAKLKKQISKYCNLITKDNLPLPSSGDCWFCALHDKDNIPMDGNKNNDHLLSHLKENYLHGSILINAMRETGYSDTGIGFHYQIKSINTFKRTVRKYLQNRLISNIAIK